MGINRLLSNYLSFIALSSLPLILYRLRCVACTFYCFVMHLANNIDFVSGAIGGTIIALSSTAYLALTGRLTGHLTSFSSPLLLHSSLYFFFFFFFEKVFLDLLRILLFLQTLQSYGV